MRASGNDARSNLSTEGLEVGALAGKVIKATAAIAGVKLEEAVIGAGWDSGDGAASAGSGNRGNGGRDTGSADSGSIGGGDAQAAAGRRVLRAIIAGRGIGGDGAGSDGDLANIDGSGNNLVTRAAGGLRDEGSHSAGAKKKAMSVQSALHMSRNEDIPRSRSDCQTNEAGAVGRARGKVGKSGTSSSNLTVAIVAGAGTLLNDRAQSQAGEREDDGSLHFQR